MTESHISEIKKHKHMIGTSIHTHIYTCSYIHTHYIGVLCEMDDMVVPDNPDTREQLSRPGIMDRQRQWSSEPEHGPGSDDLNTNDHHTHDPDSAVGRLDTEDRKFG